MFAALKEFYIEQSLICLKYKFFVLESLFIFFILVDFIFLSITTSVLKMIFLSLFLMLSFIGLIMIRIKGRF